MGRPQIIVWIAFGSSPLDASPAWSDVSSDVLAVNSIRRGRTTELGKFEAGTAEVVLDNQSGFYTPTNTVSDFYGLLRPMNPIQIMAVWNSVTYYLFRGYIERWPPIWEGGLEGQCVLPCVDAFGAIFQQQKLDYSRFSEETHWRLNAVLDAIGWPAGDRLIHTSDSLAGRSTVAAVTLTQTAPLAHMQDVVLAEDGAGFIDGRGRYQFQGRHWRYSAPESTAVQATFGDDPDVFTSWILGTSILGTDTVPRPVGWAPGDPVELPYLSIDPTLDIQYVINDAQVQANGGPVQQATDVTSQGRYSVRSATRNLLLTSNSEAADRAAWMVLQNAEPDIRIPHLVTSGHMDDVLWPAVLGLEISSRIAVVKRPPPQVASTLRRECWIEAIEHRNITDATWETTFTLSPCPDVSGRATPWILEDAISGAIDSTFYIGY